jgi:hypothetical protein
MDGVWAAATAAVRITDVHNKSDMHFVCCAKKWSYFFERWFKGAFKTMKAKDAEVNAIDDTIVIKLSLD